MTEPKEAHALAKAFDDAEGTDDPPSYAHLLSHFSTKLSVYCAVYAGECEHDEPGTGAEWQRLADELFDMARKFRRLRDSWSAPWSKQ